MFPRQVRTALALLGLLVLLSDVIDTSAILTGDEADVRESLKEEFSADVKSDGESAYMRCLKYQECVHASKCSPQMGMSTYPISTRELGFADFVIFVIGVAVFAVLVVSMARSGFHL